ncbi:MAG TPA: hypothetical protein VMX54_02740 [Vicinamibacteria bacterium]|nr:hypothetical protein [Vicinamibacteria bacterium]
MRRRALLPGLLAATLVCCAEPARELARPAGAAGVRTGLDALAAAFGPVQPDPGFDALRTALARAALVPSRAFDDPRLWSWRQDDRRAVELHGAPGGTGYRVEVRAGARVPATPGDYEGRVQLRRTSPGRFEWEVEEALATGPVRPADLADALSALFRGAERTDAAGARAAIATQLPRATAALGRLARLERLGIEHDAAHATRIELGVRLTPGALQPTAPHYAAFLRRYVSPMKLHARATDEWGAIWWGLDASDDLWNLRLRVRDGSLVPFEGPADRGIASQLRVTVDYETRMGVFTVGARELAIDVTLVRTPVEKGLLARFTREPRWRLPFLVAPLLGGPLAYPFEAEGSEAGWWAREQPGRTTLMTRRYRARVRENWLVRWLGGMTNGAVDEFRHGAEAEADRFNRECLLALGDDVSALAASGSGRLPAAP